MARIGVFVCHCGTNIAGTVDCAEVAARSRHLPGVVHSTDYKYMCSEPGQKLIQEAIAQQKLDRVVVASCSPRMHELTFRKAVEKAGLNRYLFAMSNIREQVSWVTVDGAAATAKAKALVSAAVRRVVLQEPLEMRHVQIRKRALVVAAGSPGSRRRSSSQTRDWRWSWSSARLRSAGTWRASTRRSPRSTAWPASSPPRWSRSGSTRASA